MLNLQIRRRLALPKSRLVVMTILVALAFLVLGGIAIITFNFSNTWSHVLNGIGMIISGIGLVLIFAVDLIVVVLIARTPNRRWEP